MRARLAAIALSTALCLPGCAGAPPERVREGERLLAAGNADEARKAFVSVLDDPRSTPLDRRRASVGEARAYLARGDLVGARSRLRRLDDSISEKWYLLGDIAVREREPAEAERCLRAALDRAHGPEAAALLALVIAGEARDPDRFIEAAAVLERSGDALRAGALREAAAVWRDAAGEPRVRLEKVQALKDRIGPLPAARVLEARLLERDGQAEAAAKAWELSGLSPPPSPAFQAWAAELRASLALERGGASALDAALAVADPATAAGIRSRLALARARRGDLAGALALWRRVGEAAGPGSPAWAEAAWLEEALGLPSAGEAWTKAETAVTTPGSAGSTSTLARARVAAHRAATGDVVAAAALDVDRAKGDPLPLGLEDALTRVRAARAVLYRGLDALGRGDAAAAAAFGRALRLLDPAGAAGQALTAASGAAGPAGLVGAPPSTQRALDAARLRLALAAGDLTTAATLLAAGVDASDAQPALEQAALAGLAAGRLPDVSRFLEAQGGALGAATRSRLRASAAARALPDALLPQPRGPAALPEGRAWGSLVWPVTGQRLPRVEVGVKGAERTITAADGDRSDGAAPPLDGSARLVLDPTLDAEAWSRLAPATHAEVDPPTPVEVLR